MHCLLFLSFNDIFDCPHNLPLTTLIATRSSSNDTRRLFKAFFASSRQSAHFPLLRRLIENAVGASQSTITGLVFAPLDPT